MKARVVFAVAVAVLLAVLLQGCTSVPTTAKTETVVIYDNHTIPANIGISTGTYIKVSGYRYVNIVVEFEQKTAGESRFPLVWYLPIASMASWVQEDTLTSKRISLHQPIRR